MTINECQPGQRVSMPLPECELNGVITRLGKRGVWVRFRGESVERWCWARELDRIREQVTGREVPNGPG